jgi:Helix-turn-helix domain
MKGNSSAPTRTPGASSNVIQASVVSRHHAVWLSIRRAADRAGVCPRTLKRWIKGGLLPATRLPSPKGKGHLRIRLGDLEALLARGVLQ